MTDKKSFNYKGVYEFKLGSNWVAKVPVGCSFEFIGYYDTQHHAALAYNFGLELLGNTRAERNLIHPSHTPKKALQDEIRAAVATKLESLLRVTESALEGVPEVADTL